MSPPPRLASEVHITFIIILQESGGHAAATLELAISSVQTSFQLPTSRNVKFFMVSIIVNVFALITVVSSISVISFKVVSEQVDSIFILCHLINIVNVPQELCFFISFVVIVIKREHGGRGGRS
jgi:hypothetical protein